MLQDDLKNLHGRLLRAWSGETSYDATRWTSENPAYGQCAITACIVQDECGGDIVGAEYIQPDGARDLHFFNVIGGRYIDLTRDQFPAGTLIKAAKPMTEGHNTTREFILSFDTTRARYEMLKARMK